MINLGTNDKKILYFSMLYFIYGFKTLLIGVNLTPSDINIFKDVLNILLFTVIILASVGQGLKFIIIMGVVSLLLVINSVFFGNIYLYDFIILLPMLSIINGVDRNKLIKLCFYMNIVMVLIIIPFLFESNSYYRVDDRIGLRFSYGFRTENTLAQYLIMLYGLSVLYMYRILTKKTHAIFMALMILPLPYALIYFTGSRTGLFVLILTAAGFVLSFFFKKDEKQYHMLKRALVALIILIASFQMYSAINFSNESWLLLANEILSSRVWLSNILYKSMGAPYFIHGVNLENYMPIDFYFIQYFYSFGIVLSSIFIFVFIRGFFRNTYTMPMLVVIFSSILSTLTESYFEAPTYNFALIIIFSYTLIDEKKIEK